MPVIPLLAGAVLAAGLVAVGRRRSTARELDLYAIGLVVAAAIYVGFAARAGTGALVRESLGLALYGAAAVLGARRWPWVLALGWAAHVAWDLAVPRPAPAYVPAWWAPLCLVFDLVIAARVAQLARRLHVLGQP